MDTKIPLDDQTKKILERLDGLWRFADQQMGRATFQTDGDLRKVILLSLTAASQRTVRSILSQVKGGSIDGLENHIRTLVENIINAKYILEDETQNRARAYIINDHIDRRRTVRKLVALLENGTAPAMATVTDATRYRDLEEQLSSEIEQFEREYGRENIMWPNLEQRARACNSEELYVTVFWLLSHDSHTTARGVDRYMAENQSGGITIQTGQDLSRAYVSIFSAYTNHLALLSECNQKFGIPDHDELEQFTLPEHERAK